MVNLTYHPKKEFCSRGHEIAVVGRTKFGQCIPCKKINDAKVNANPEIKAKKIQWAEEHPNYWPSYRDEHNDELLEAAHEYYEANKEACLARMKKYNAEHPEVQNALHTKYQTNRGLRVVTWSDLENIKVIYAMAHSKGMEVDHYIPLQGDEVSGLHVSWNLKPLTAEENRLKHNSINLVEASEWYGNILKEAGLK